MTLNALKSKQRALPAALWMSLGISVGISVAGAVCAGSAAAQTVNDYENALVAAATAPDVDAACRPLVNYTFVSIAPADQVDPSPLFSLFSAMFGADTAADPTAKARDACLARLKHPVIAFNGGLGEDIVAQPAVEDPTKPLGEQRPQY